MTARARVWCLAAWPELIRLPITAANAETSHLTFVSEYVRELLANERSRAVAEKEIAEQGSDKNPAIIRNSTRIVLELRSQIGTLNGMTLNPPFAELPGSVAQFYAEEINVHNQFMAIAVALSSGPKPGVDYGAMVIGCRIRISGRYFRNRNQGTSRS
jgi:hypothetical protein